MLRIQVKGYVSLISNEEFAGIFQKRISYSEVRDASVSKSENEEVDIYNIVPGERTKITFELWGGEEGNKFIRANFTLEFWEGDAMGHIVATYDSLGGHGVETWIVLPGDALTPLIDDAVDKALAYKTAFQEQFKKEFDRIRNR